MSVNQSTEKMKSKTKIGSIVLASIFSSLFLANFAFAQTGPDSTALVTLDKAAEAASQQSLSECIKFSNLVWNATSQQARAIWDPTVIKSVNGVPENGGCYIVQAKYPGIANDNITASSYDIPVQYTQIQQQIREGQGITSAQFTAANTQATNDQGAASAPSQWVGRVLAWLFDIITTFVLALTALAGELFSYFVGQAVSGTGMPQIVNVGWAIVRDICNMFFILILIVIALATILGFEKYNYRKLLRDVIIMALLVNFSQVIAVTIINFTNFLIAVFAGNDIHFQVIFVKLVKFIWAGGESLPYGGASAALLQGIGKLVFAIVALAAFLVLAGLLLVRQVGLYVLVILSPIAYVLYILPQTKNYAEEWWRTFIKYLVWGPVALFFVRLTISIVDTKDALAYGKAGESAFSFIILAAFLFAAVMVALKAGMVGSQTVVNGLNAGRKWGAKKGDMWLASGAKSPNAGRRALSYLSVGAAVKGYQMQAKKREHEAYTQAAGQRADQFTALLSRGRKKTEFGKRAMRSEWIEEMKLNQTSDEEELKHVVQGGIDSKNSAEVAGGLLKLAHDGNINEIVGGTTAEHMQRYIRGLVDKNVMKENDAKQLGMDITRIAEELGQYNFARAYEGDGHGGIQELGGLGGQKIEDLDSNDPQALIARNQSENKRQAIIQSQMKKPNQQQLYRQTTRLGGGFDIKDNPVLDPVTNQPVIGADGREVTERIVQGVQEHGRKMIENISDPNGFRQTGNKELKTYYMISASKDMYDANPEVWLHTANEFMGKNEKQRAEAYSIATTTAGRIAEGQRFGKKSDDKSGEIEDDAQIRANINTLIEKKVVSRDDFKTGKAFGNLQKYVE